VVWKWWLNYVNYDRGYSTTGAQRKMASSPAGKGQIKKGRACNMVLPKSPVMLVPYVFITAIKNRLFRPP
jgi:hypothetical protein